MGSALPQSARSAATRPRQQQLSRALRSASTGAGSRPRAPISTLRLWNRLLWRNLAELQDEVCSLAVSGLSKAEWEQYAAGVPYRNSCP